jgi:hypothetical protein
MLLTMSASGPGSVTPATGLVDSGVVVAIHGTPNSKWDTLGWWTNSSVDVVFNSDTTGVYIKAPGTVTATFGTRGAIAPTLSLPASGDTTIPKSTTFKWLSNGVLADSTYILALSIDTFKTTLSLDTVLAPDTVKAKTMDSLKCWYAWKVKGGNHGGWSAYSEVRYFRTAASSAGGFAYMRRRVGHPSIKIATSNLHF